MGPRATVAEAVALVETGDQDPGAAAKAGHCSTIHGASPPAQVMVAVPLPSLVMEVIVIGVDANSGTGRENRLVCISAIYVPTAPALA